MIEQFGEHNHAAFCDRLTKKDKDLRAIIKQYGYPPVWTRDQHFASLIHIILEQQVSLASAKAAFNKLNEFTGKITPEKILAMSDEELRSCYFSRQKTVYARALAAAVVSKQIELKKFPSLPDEEIRIQLKKIKGIGDWTVDIYLLFALQRCDIFPTGDLAMMNAFKEVKRLPKETTKEEIIQLAEKWRPYRSIATYMLWHYYIRKKNIKI